MKKLFIIIAIISAIILLLMKDHLGPISLDNDKLPNVIYFIIILSAFIISIANSKMPLFQIVKYSAAWVLIIGGMLVIYSYKNDVKNVVEHVYANVVPGSIIKSEDGNSMSVIANQSGHFFVNAIVDGLGIKFMVDTGATDVALTRGDAKSLGIDLDALSYGRKVSTANGTAWSASVTLDYIEIGDIRIENVSASVGSDDGLNTSLLGMSFLNKLKLFQVTEDSLQMVGE